MKKSSRPIKVIIAGIGGASLGTEIYKSLLMAGGYEIYGCDISPLAYGLYEKGFSRTYCVRRNGYISNVLRVCFESGAEVIIPGGEQPMSLISAASEKFKMKGVRIVSNSQEVISLYSRKDEAFKHLKEYGIPIPRTTIINSITDINYVGLPCIVKPATDTGGSAEVFFSVSSEEALVYSELIRRTGRIPIAQEYVNDNEGEFTIGVISLPDKQVIGSIALRRAFETKLSVAYRARGGLISSGYSQGYIGRFPDICRQAERIASVIGSRGPINVQGRVRDGVLLPFEINPRFSASTYLRAMAGFNEVDILTQYFVNGMVPARPVVKTGWYLRSLTEQYIKEEQLK